MSGRVDVQSSARRSYKAVVMPTDALLTLGMLKFTSLMMASFRTIAVNWGGCVRQWRFSWAANSGNIVRARQADAACTNGRDEFRDGGVCEMQVVMVLMPVGCGTKMIGCCEPWGITMLAWTWSDRTNGREVSSEIHRSSRLGGIDATAFGDAVEEERFFRDAALEGCWT